MERCVYEKEYKIHYYEIDYKQKLLVTSLMNYLCDVAVNHGENLGVGISYAKSKGIGWVLYNISLDMYKYPVYDDVIKIKTYGYSFNKFYAYRKFEVYNINGEMIAEANSLWIMIDLQKRRPTKIPKEMFEAYGIAENSDDKLEIRDIRQLEKVDNDIEFKVRYSDIDTNRHVNNVKYVAWSIEAVPVEVVLNATLMSLDIMYKKETTYGEVIKDLTQVIEEEDRFICVHKIINNEGKELNFAQTTWIKNEYCGKI